MIKSPLNYIGGKFKLLPQLLPLFPKDINTFFDVFGGGFNVGINVNARSYVYNDKEEKVTSMLRYFYDCKDTGELLREIDGYIKQYNLSKTNKEGYLQLRADYNAQKVPYPNTALYTLICHGFNNQIRFNKKKEYNVSFGKDRSSFNPVLREKFIDFHKALIAKNIEFMAGDFSTVFAYLHAFSVNDVFVYLDPPYLNSDTSYVKQDGWTKADEDRLLPGLDELNGYGIKFALSNNLKYNDYKIEEWSKSYNVHYLDADYSNCNYAKKDKGKSCEILVTNY